MLVGQYATPKPIKGNGTFKFTLAQFYNLIDKPTTIKDFEAIIPLGNNYKGIKHSAYSDSVGYTYTFGYPQNNTIAMAGVMIVVNIRTDEKGYINRVEVEFNNPSYYATSDKITALGFIDKGTKYETETYLRRETTYKIYEKSTHTLEVLLTRGSEFILKK